VKDCVNFMLGSFSLKLQSWEAIKNLN